MTTKEETTWKEHQIYTAYNRDPHELEDAEFVFQLFSNDGDEKDKYDVFEYNIPLGCHALGHKQENGFENDDNKSAIDCGDCSTTLTKKIKLRGQSECTNSTGLGIWIGAQVLCDYLTSHPLIVRNKHVLELGAGTGLCGIVACSCLDAKEVVLTDGDTNVLSNLRYNIQQNCCDDERDEFEQANDTHQTVNQFANHSDGCRIRHTDVEETRRMTSTNKNKKQIRCHQLIWGQNVEHFVQQLQDQGRKSNNSLFDVILASDCVYMTPSLKPLWETVYHLLEPTNGIFIYVNLSASQVPVKKVLQTAASYGYTWSNPPESKFRDVYLFQQNKGKSIS